MIGPRRKPPRSQRQLQPTALATAQTHPWPTQTWKKAESKQNLRSNLLQKQRHQMSANSTPLHRSKRHDPRAPQNKSAVPPALLHLSQNASAPLYLQPQVVVMSHDLERPFAPRKIKLVTAASSAVCSRPSQRNQISVLPERHGPWILARERSWNAVPQNERKPD